MLKASLNRVLDLVVSAIDKAVPADHGDVSYEACAMLRAGGQALAPFCFARFTLPDLRGQTPTFGNLRSALT
jgi:hypothetical protein